MNKKSDGLRERKRHETRQALETAAIELVSNGGLEHTTIEAISQRANVSARTFFNYFDSKEDALLGLHNIELSDDAIDACAEQHRSDSLSTAVISLMVQLIGPTLTNRELYKSRRQLIKQHPQLLERQIDRMAHIGKRLVKATQRIAAQSSNTQLPDDEAEILLALCSSSVRVVIREWTTTSQSVSLPRLEQQAIQKLNEVIKRI